ncbi:MAG: 6-pyruvoyl tetrahydropterin reductase [Gammaproteobacteria bacterium]|nr:MAG: 6-pyruvoyl tetrahydropterin reductase [Gammaproteobacteria bacterium]
MAALFVDHLTVMDFSFAHPERGILGESWIVDVILHGELDDQGMVFDFGDVKKQLKRAIDELYDHRLLVPDNLPELHACKIEQQLELHWQDTQGRKYQHISPENAVVMLAVDVITPESVAPHLEQQVARILPENVDKLTIKIRPEAIPGAYYHYSHGLKKHRGNCQRIAHGHRSAIEIYLDQHRSSALEQQWSQQWQDIYIGTREDINKTYQADGTEYIQFAYQSEQGYFELTLPAANCYLITSDSTVEHIASHIASEIKQQHPDQQVMVKAFEGVWKGAIAIRE